MTLTDQHAQSRWWVRRTPTPTPTAVYQPLMDLARWLGQGDPLVAYEGLSRFGWGRAPQRVFEQARAQGTALKLELAAIERQIEALDRLGGNLFLTLNVSPCTIRSRTLRAMLKTIDARRVVLEVTESAPVGSYATFNKAMDRLRSLGVRLAVDDLGSGYASLRHLLHLRPELVKLDIELVQGVSRDATRQSLILALASFSSDIGAVVVAEGLERPEDLRTAALLGATVGQGFLLGEPGTL